jgi:glutamate racemase
VTEPSIGVFDSGVGGLSVLRALRATLPGANFRYVADSSHAPYGERSDRYVIERALRIARELHRQGATLLVVACNTATAVAVDTLRAAWPDMPIVGIEPGIKPALARTLNRRVGVMATRATLASERFASLLRTQCSDSTVQVHLRACDGLASAIETGELDSAEVRSAVEQHCKALRAHDVDTVVLGCTHYPFAAHQIQAAMGASVVLIDTSAAVAREVARRWQSAATGRGKLTLQTTGDASLLQAIASRWLGADHAGRTSTLHID